MSGSELPDRVAGPTVFRSELPLPLLHRGKVRDVYEAGPDTLLMVASDRVSAFDVVLARPIPRKGEVLTQITAWWLSRPDFPAAHHLLAVDPDVIADALPALAGMRDSWAGRAMLVHRTAPLPVECVVRGYLSGSAWKEYREKGTLAGEPLPVGMAQSARLDPPLFSPATKAVEGHDENIPYDEVVRLLGEERSRAAKGLSFDVYGYGARVAEERGIILADTKFEFGTDREGRLLLIDEVLTPDSSRFWPAEQYATGRGQTSLDKQPIRDYLDAQPEWDRTPPAPELPDAVVEATTARYLDIFQRLTGTPLDDFDPPRFNFDPAPEPGRSDDG
ncbi:MAG: phosphoribosylaminoimidazolesuccinocarboxamide synthase [Gemmatimonadota bacterium]